jgi:hypothetical protein
MENVNHGVGLPLMPSPHPSYPPLEMAHFGVLTITNGYANKDLSSAHDNIISIRDIRPVTIAEVVAIAAKLSRYRRGCLAKTHMPSFLVPGPVDCVTELSNALKSGPERARTVELSRGVPRATKVWLHAEDHWQRIAPSVLCVGSATHPRFVDAPDLASVMGATSPHRQELSEYLLPEGLAKDGHPLNECWRCSAKECRI